MDDPGSGSRPTIYDVARLAGVTAPTVSRTFTQPGRVSIETAARVRAAAEQLGYSRLSPIANKAPGHHPTILFVVADSASFYFADVLAGAQAAATAAARTLLLTTFADVTAGVRRQLDDLVPIVEGMVLANSHVELADIRTFAKQRPVLLVNRGAPGISSIRSDDRRGASAALHHLAHLKHRRISYLCGLPTSWSSDLRWRALRDGARTLGMTVDKRGPTPPTVEGGLQAAEEVLDDLPSAVVTYNDQIAVGLMMGLRHAGVAVPQEVSIIGFDDTVAARLVSPPLTSIAVPLRAIGAAAVNGILEVSKNPSAGPVRRVFPTELVIRASTGPASAMPSGVTRSSPVPPAVRS